MKNCKTITTDQNRTINIVAMSCVFSGPPRAGKTTVVKRLKGEDVDINEKSASTGVVDERGIVRIDFIPSSNVVTDQEWVEMEEDDEVQAFLNLTIIPQQTGSDEDLLIEEESEMSPSSHVDTQPPTTVDGASVPSQATKTPPQKSTASKPKMWHRFRHAFRSGRKPIVKVSPQAVEAPSSTVKAQSASSSLSVTNVPPTPTMLPQHASCQSQSTERDKELENTSGQNVSDAVETHQGSEQSDSKVSEESDSDVIELSPKSVLQEAQLHSQQIRAKRRLCKRHFLYLSDTGGQPEFRKMIALLIPGQSITFAVFDMRYEFDSRYPVRYCHCTNEDEIEYSSFSIKGTINDIIEHIFCSELHSKVKGSIMFIGTHKDMIPKEEREDKVMCRNEELRLILKECPHYHPDMIIKSDEDNIIFCVDNRTFENEHKCIRSSVLRICETERFQVKVKPELLLLALTLKSAKVTVLPYDTCAKLAMDCGILEEDVRKTLLLLHEKLMMIRVYELNQDNVIVVVKPKALINKVSSLLKFMLTRDEQVYSKPLVSYTKLHEIATDGERMDADVLIKIFVHLLIIAPIPKSENEAVEFIVPAMLPDSTPTETEYIVGRVPSTPKAVRARSEPNQLLFAFKPFRFSVPSTLHCPVLCSLLQNKQCSIQYTGGNLFKTCIAFSNKVESTVTTLTFTVTFFKECVSLYLGQEWNKSNLSREMLEQCTYAEQAVMSALRQALTLVGYGDHHVHKYCLSCFEKSVFSAGIQGDCSMSHAMTPAYPDNIWFSKVSFIVQ